MLDAVEARDFAGPFEVFSTAARLAACQQPPPFVSAPIAARVRTVRARSGLPRACSASIADHPPLDLLIVTDGAVDAERVRGDVVVWIAHSAPATRITAAPVCAGASPLAAAGLLNVPRATTHWEDADDLGRQSPRVTVHTGPPWMDDDRIVTSAGIDMSLPLVSRLAGEPVPNLPPLIASRYVPVRFIAKGGMGVVYEVEHARTGEHLALKVLQSGAGSSADALERFKREARASARINSEHVVRVTDAGLAPELDGAPFLVMDLLKGADLEREVAATPASPATVVEWLRQVARALDKADRLGIVHRDLKPENLFLVKAEDRAPIVKILDFGIVKDTEERDGGTSSGKIIGTPKYMAPEQVSAGKSVTPAADRYALGLVAYRLLTGESYYSGNVMTILAQLLHGPLEPPSARHPELAGAFDAWFNTACHRDPAQRFRSASEQIEALSAALGLPAVPTGAAREPTGNQRRPRRRVVPAMLVGAVFAAVLIAGTIFNRHPVTIPEPTAVPTATPPVPAVDPRPPERPVVPAATVLRDGRAGGRDGSCRSGVPRARAGHEEAAPERAQLLDLELHARIAEPGIAEVARAAVTHAP